MASVADIYLERGRSQANYRRASGQNSAQMLSNLGQIGQQAIGSYSKYLQEAPQREMDAMALESARGQRASAQREAQEEQGLRELFATSESPDPKAIIAIVGPERGTKIVTALSALSDTNMQRFKSQQEIVAATLAGLDAIPENLRKDVYSGIRQNLIQRRVIGEQDAPEAYDPQWFQQARNFGQAAPKPSEGYTLTPGSQRYGPDGKLIASAPVAEKPEEGAYVTVKGPGGRPVRQWVPKTKLETGVEEYREPQAPRAPEPLEAIIGPNGQPVLVPRSQAIGKMPATNREKPTEDERKTAGFYKQMRDAITTIDELEDQITEKELYQIQSLPQEQLMGMANRNQLSEAAKRYLRAFNQFTESRLRPVSGAAINDSEYARDRQTYAKQFGETPKLKEDRSRARNLALSSLGDRAGVLKPKDEGSGDQVPPPVLAAGPGEHTFANGQTWKVSADGKTAKRIK